MDDKKMIDDLVKMLDSGMAAGVGHVNVDYNQEAEQSKNVQTMGCTDCSRTPLACSVPTLEQGLDDLIAEDRPVLCEIFCKEDQKYFHTSFRKGVNGTLVRPPIEDQSPFMDRELFLSEMIVEPIDL